MKKFLPMNITTIFVLLGKRCNLNCKYCLQKPFEQDGQNDQVLNDSVIDFITELSENQVDKITIQFYGGEPLLYLDTIKEMHEKLSGIDNLEFSIITNGTLLTKEIVEWLNVNDFKVAVSWDGPNTVNSRGVDVFKNKKLKPVILALKYLTISAVISAYSYPLEIMKEYAKIDRKYFDIHKHNCMINFDEIMDTGIDSESLAIDCDRVYSDMTKIANEYVKFMNNKKSNPYMCNLAMKYINFIKFSVSRNTFERSMPACNNGYNVLNIDLQGNLYRCHNTNEMIGTISDPYFKYLEKLLQLDNTKEYSKICVECDAVSLCNCGCPIVAQEARDNGYCKLKRAMFLPIINCLFSLSKK